MFATQLIHAPWDAGDSLKDQPKPLVSGKGAPKLVMFWGLDLFMDQLGWNTTESSGSK